jgi:hypothetical protein
MRSSRAEVERMSNDRPDPAEFLEMAQRMLRGLFGGQSEDDDVRSSDPRGGDSWGEATRRGNESARERHREPTPERQRENLTFALATRAVEALEDVALNVAAIRQRLERTAPPPTSTGAPAPDVPDPGPLA